MKTITLLAVCVCLSTTIAAHAVTKITPSQAEASAVKKIPGKAVSSKYEFEDGRWQYAVLVKNRTGLYEVEVNANTGKVTDTEKTSAREEAQEAAADEAAAKKANRAHKSK
jgi:hypothetical protein